MNQIRKVVKTDIEALIEVLNSIELFPAEMLEDMIADYFNNPKTKDIWFTTLQNNQPISIAFCAPEKLTEGTYNLYAIGVKSEIQGKGIGSQMMAYIEKYLKQSGNRILIVETSGAEEYQLTRKFYENLNYTKEATIREFWSKGEDKVIFWKKLN